MTRERPSIHPPGAFRRALDDRLKNAAKVAAVPTETMRRRFVLECYLARVFSLSECRWVLKGGAGLAERIPRARHSQDLDLFLADDQELHVSVEELVAAGRAGPRDPFTFEITRRRELTGITDGIQLAVHARLGATTYATFPIDVTALRMFVGAIEIVNQPLPVQIDDVAEPPPMRLYPLCDQVADKIAAMYQTYSGRPSTRYRDLVDVVLITEHKPPDVTDLIAALRLQGIARRITLPIVMTSPAPTREAGYPAAARSAGLMPALTHVEDALAHVGRHLNPALRGVAALRR